MGKHIIAKTGNIAAVQQPLGHRQAADAMQCARSTTAELDRGLDDCSAQTRPAWWVALVCAGLGWKQRQHRLTTDPVIDMQRTSRFSKEHTHRWQMKDAAQHCRPS